MKSMKIINTSYDLVNFFQIHVLVILFLLAWLLWERFLSKDENMKARSYRYIISMFVAVIVAEIANCVWAFCTYKFNSYHIISDICNVVYFISLTLMCPCWLYYQCAFGRGRLCSTPIRRIFFAIPYLLFAAAVVLSPKTHIIFYTDAENIYHQGPYFWLYFTVIGFYFLLSLLASLFRYMHAGSYIEEKLNLVLISMPLTFLSFLVLRLFYRHIDFMSIAVIMSLGVFYFLKNRYKLIDFINDDFLAVFSVDVDKYKMKTILASDEYLKMVYCPLSVEFPFENALEGIRNHVIDDDRFMIEKEFNPESIYLRLKGDHSYSIIYRVRTYDNDILFFQNKFIAIPHSRNGERVFLLCVKNVESDIENDNVFDRFNAEQKEFERKRELYNVISVIAGDYDVIANVDLDTQKISFYQQNSVFKDKMSRIPPDKRGYKDCLHIFVKNQIFPEDQKRYLKRMNLAHVLAAADKTKVISCRFRMLTDDGSYLWYETRIIYLSGNRCIMTIRNVDNEVKQEAIFRKEKASREATEVIDGLSRDFSCVLLVDPVTMENTTFSKEEKYAKLIDEWEGSFDFETRLVLMRTKYIIPEDREQFARATQKNVILDYLKDHSTYFVNYRSQIEGRIENWQMKFVMVESDDAKKLVVGFHNIDNEVSLENQRYAVISELTKDYLFVDYVRLANPGDIFDKDTIMHYQIDEDFHRSIPDWDKEESFSAKLNLLRDYFVVTEDRSNFAENVNFEKIMQLLRISSSFSYAFRAVVKGKTTHCQIRFIAYSDKKTGELKGTVVGVRSIETEVSKELRHIADMEKAREAAESASRSKSSFLFNMSHDMRTPMNAILGFTELAKNADGDMNKINDYLDNIGIAGEHLLNLINDILDMARIESGKVSLTENEIDIAANADDLYSIIKKSAESKRIDFSIDHTGIKNRRVFVDKMHLNQVVLNLISNSIKYTPDGGKVSYSITESPAEKAGYSVYEMVVADTGMGMDAKFLATLFDPFTRSDDAVKSGAQGTGLGMAITKHLIEQMHGSIKVDSELGKGTTAKVSFTLRLAEQQKDVAKEAAADAAANSDMDLLRGKKVLLVDDNKLNQKLATAVLNIGKLVVDVASNGGEALDKVKSHDPDYYDFILMDVQMPQMDGYETTKAIRSLTEADYSHVPIIAMTANAFEEDKMKAFAAGMNSHVAKPINVKVLFSVLCGFIKDKMKAHDNG